jgi:hypothetical protein
MTWVIWAIILMVQNFAFTFVSRARNSGSIQRHMFASIFSNGVWFVSQMIIFQKLFKLMMGEQGWAMGVFTAFFYTTFTMAGSLLAHYHALRTEKGKTAVGANLKYAQIPKEEYEELKQQVSTLMYVNRHPINDKVGYVPKPVPPIPSQYAGGRAVE